MTAQFELWKQLAERLSIVVIAPVELEITGERLAFTALLPQFGGDAGIVVDPKWEVIEPHTDTLIKAGFGYSAVALNETADDDSVCEMLRDWGWSEAKTAPDWL